MDIALYCELSIIQFLIIIKIIINCESFASYRVYRVYRVYREPFAESLPLNTNGSNEDKVNITYLNPLLSLR